MTWATAINPKTRPLSLGETRRVHGPNRIKVSSPQELETNGGGLNPGHPPIPQPYESLHAGAKVPGSPDAAG